MQILLDRHRGRQQIPIPQVSGGSRRCAATVSSRAFLCQTLPVCGEHGEVRSTRLLRLCGFCLQPQRGVTYQPRATPWVLGMVHHLQPEGLRHRCVGRSGSAIPRSCLAPTGLNHIFAKPPGRCPGLVYHALSGLRWRKSWFGREPADIRTVSPRESLITWTFFLDSPVAAPPRAMQRAL